MAYVGRNEGYNVVVAVVAGDECPARSVAHCSLVFPPCSLRFRLAVVACVAQCAAAVGSPGAVEAGNIVADIDDGRNAYAVAAGGGRSASGAGHILEASGAGHILEASGEADAWGGGCCCCCGCPSAGGEGGCCCVESCAATQTRAATSTAQVLLAMVYVLILSVSLSTGDVACTVAVVSTVLLRRQAGRQAGNRCECVCVLLSPKKKKKPLF